jgi:hypothetical protein
MGREKVEEGVTPSACLPHEDDKEADLFDEIHRLEWIGRKESRNHPAI